MLFLIMLAYNERGSSGVKAASVSDEASDSADLEKFDTGETPTS